MSGAATRGGDAGGAGEVGRGFERPHLGGPGDGENFWVMRAQRVQIMK